jgi:DNA-binding LacI/PurR family transcriptional regulator
MGATKRLTIGLIVGNICNAFFSTMVRAIESTVLQYGYKVIVCNTDESIEMDLIHARELMEHGVNGIIVSTTALDSVTGKGFFKRRAQSGFAQLDTSVETLEPGPQG